MSSEYLDHFASFDLLDVAELAGVADQLAALHGDNALGASHKGV